MTVGAVVLPDDAGQALADASGRVAVRRIVESAWAGGALPIIVVVSDGQGQVAASLEGSPARVIEAGGAQGAAAARRGIRAARQAVRETSAFLLWPGRMAWIDPETVTSLIEAHGRGGRAAMRPLRATQAGWPVLVTAAGVDKLFRDGRATLEEAIAALEMSTVELGDPGSVLGMEVALEDLPAYAGPPEPVGGPPPDWGAAAAETPDPEVAPGSE